MRWIIFVEVIFNASRLGLTIKDGSENRYIMIKDDWMGRQ